MDDRENGREDQVFPEGWEITFEDEKVAQGEAEWGNWTLYFDPEDAREDGYTPDDENYRGLFFSREDAEEYAATIGLPVVFVETNLGIEVYIDYKGN